MESGKRRPNWTADETEQVIQFPYGLTWLVIKGNLMTLQVDNTDNTVNTPETTAPPSIDNTHVKHQHGHLLSYYSMDG